LTSAGSATIFIANLLSSIRTLSPLDKITTRPGNISRLLTYYTAFSKSSLNFTHAKKLSALELFKVGSTNLIRSFAYSRQDVKDAYYSISIKPRSDSPILLLNF